MTNAHVNSILEILQSVLSRNINGFRPSITFAEGPILFGVGVRNLDGKLMADCQSVENRVRGQFLSVLQGLSCMFYL